jgi:hypothetical protein
VRLAQAEHERGMRRAEWNEPGVRWRLVRSTGVREIVQQRNTAAARTARDPDLREL